MKKIFLTYLLWIPQLLLILVSFIVVPFMLNIGWQGYTTWFGNRQYGRFGNKGNHRDTYDDFVFLCIVNPVSNFGKEVMSVTVKRPVMFVGDPLITDGKPGIEGSYIATSGWKWEVRVVKKTFPGRCFEGRWGWKLLNKQLGEQCTFVCRANPFKKFG